MIRGTDELTQGVTSRRRSDPNNLDRLQRALEELEAKPAGRRRLALEQALQSEPVVALQTARGELRVVPEPAGTRRGYDDLRRAATREHIGHGLRPSVASVPDLARMAAALGRAEHRERAQELRRVLEGPERRREFEP